ncbi:SDR family NAD(P)-dependent oxidoreductase [Pseudomonas azerbaijanoccidentalis]
MIHPENPLVLVLAGANESFGGALAKRFIDHGYRVVGLSRSAQALPLEGYLPMACDLTDETQVNATFERIEQTVGTPSVVIHSVGDLLIAPFLQTPVEAFERVWRSMVLSATVVGRAAIEQMLPRQSGSLMFCGATASLRGGANFAAFAAAKFALRGLAQSLAREFQPQGIHVTHLLLDGLIGDSADGDRLMPGALADNFIHLAHQASAAWTHELDLRPYRERF